MIYVFFRYKKNADFILIDVYSGWAFYYSLTIAVLAGIFKIKYITVLHGGNLLNRLNNNTRLSKFIFNNSYKNISPSYYLKYIFESKGYDIFLIPNSIEIKKYKFKKRSICSPKLLWVRSFHKIYNPQLAIQVLSILRKKYPNVSLCMVGPEKDSSMKECKELANELLLLKHIEFKGFLKKQDWLDLSNNFDIFINTTNFDNDPISVKEAMALGLPIVSTNVGGLKYLLQNGKNALLVNANDQEDMATQIDKVISNIELATKLSLNARKKAESFSWENNINKWKKLLSKDTVNIYKN